MEEYEQRVNCVKLGGQAWKVLSLFANHETYDTINEVLSILSDVLYKYPQFDVFGINDFTLYVDGNFEEMEISCDVKYKDENGELSHKIIVQGCNGLIENFFVLDGMQLETGSSFFYGNGKEKYVPYNGLNRMS